MLLTVELIPKTCFFVNCRSILTQGEWDKVRKQVYKNVNYKCEICENPYGNIEAHEIFEYDDENKIQKLISIAGLCKNCHSCKHPGLAQIQGRYEKMLNHFSKINQLSLELSEIEMEKAFVIWNERSKYNWKLDISHLKEYNFDKMELERRCKK